MHSMVLESSFCAFLARPLEVTLLWSWRGSTWPKVEPDGSQATLSLPLTVQRKEAAQGSAPPGAKLGPEPRSHLQDHGLRSLPGLLCFPVLFHPVPEYCEDT